MIKQIQTNQTHQETQNHDVIEFKSQMIFSNIVQCNACGQLLQFTEGDIIYGENWYHNNCWEQVRGQNV